MNRNNLQKVPTVFLLCFAITAMGCEDGCDPQVKYERTVRLSAPMPANTIFETQTHNGYIDITGADVTECSLTATIVSRAFTEEEAQKIAEETKVELVPSGNKLIAKIEKPKEILGRKIHVSVSLDVTVPNKTNTDVLTHNGALGIKNLIGQIKGKTHNGKVTAEKISGTAELETHNGKVDCQEVTGKTKLLTHNGSITCKDTSGDTELRTHNGNTEVFYSSNAQPVCNISAVTHNGSVRLTAPPNLSAKIEASTHNGSITTDLPIIVTGKVSKHNLTGTIGQGEGKLYLETHNGSINIR